jgi:hypothetical protein
MTVRLEPPEATTASVRNCLVSATAQENLGKMELTRWNSKVVTHPDVLRR